MAVRIGLTCPARTLIIQKLPDVFYCENCVVNPYACVMCFSNYWKQPVICVTRFMIRNGLQFFIL